MVETTENIAQCLLFYSSQLCGSSETESLCEDGEEYPRSVGRQDPRKGIKLSQ